MKKSIARQWVNWEHILPCAGFSTTIFLNKSDLLYVNSPSKKDSFCSWYWINFYSNSIQVGRERGLIINFVLFLFKRLLLRHGITFKGSDKTNFCWGWYLSLRSRRPSFDASRMCFFLSASTMENLSSEKRYYFKLLLTCKIFLICNLSHSWR